MKGLVTTRLSFFSGKSDCYLKILLTLPSEALVVNELCIIRPVKKLLYKISTNYLYISMFQQKSFPAAWGSFFNLSSGSVVVDEQTFSLVPNGALTALTFSIGKKAYSVQTFPIEAIIGYKGIFMAWMSILLNDGSKVNVSIGTNEKKRALIEALEQQRAAIFAAKGQVAPRLVSVI